ncbi:MAG: hypothetical protein IT436_13540 [Phycisphaerales bacterium]|nr:hypothetical protein [Phycisphaerales bacterium]
MLHGREPALRQGAVNQVPQLDICNAVFEPERHRTRGFESRRVVLDIEPKALRGDVD